MNVLRLAVSLNQFIVAGHMGKNPQLNLGIIRIYEETALFRIEALADQPAQLLPHRYILQVGIRTGQPSRRRHSLLK